MKRVGNSCWCGSEDVVCELHGAETTSSNAGNMGTIAAMFASTCCATSLQAQRRLPKKHTAKCKLIYVNMGTLSLDVVLPGGRRQILDFLLAGDVVSTDWLPHSNVSIRAITEAAVTCLDEQMLAPLEHTVEYSARLFACSQSQLARANIHRLMIGHLDTVSRVASFLLMLALRSSSKSQNETPMPLPMSRDDIADYLAMNPDTLSRIMMRFEALALISRTNRRSICVENIAGLKNLTPIAGLVVATFEADSAKIPPEFVVVS
jgi:CRP/FNR family transcriptional regulator, anaerobic regulatory protein